MRTLRAGGAIARCAAAPAFAPSRLRLRRARFWLWLRFWSRTPTWAMGSARRGRKLPFGRRNRRDVAENSHLGDEIGETWPKTPIWAMGSARRGRKSSLGRRNRRNLVKSARLGDGFLRFFGIVANSAYFGDPRKEPDLGFWRFAARGGGGSLPAVRRYFAFPLVIRYAHAVGAEAASENRRPNRENWPPRAWAT